MYLKLSKSEIRALRLLCAQDASVGEMAARLKAKPSFASRILAGLLAKDLVLAEKKGTTKIFRLSSASHAQKFRQLSDSRPNAEIEEWLSGGAIDLLVVANGGVEIDRLLEEASSSRATLYGLLRKMGAVGAAVVEKGTVRIPDSLVASFAEAYADNIQLLMQEDIRGINVSVRVRKHVILRTDAKSVPNAFAETGVSALAKRGLEAFLTSYRDFYFNLDGKRRELSTEECLVHAILLTSLRYNVDLTVLGLFFAKNARRLNLRLLKKLAKEYGVEGQLDGLRQKTEFYEKMRSFA
ncbi:Uncharacterised protein [uncultured archaeon]|nr:Uncharacterised protein [uncultured archaeon]